VTANAAKATHPGAGGISHGGSERRNPEHGVLYRALQDHLETFLAAAAADSDDGAGVPKFVEKEVRAFLSCGVLSKGFARFACTGCDASGWWRKVGTRRLADSRR
jgi:hypothetical protein